MTAFLALLLLIFTLNLSSESLKGVRHTAHPAAVEFPDAKNVDRTPVCRYGEGASMQRDLSPPTPPAGEAAPTQP